MHWCFISVHGYENMATEEKEKYNEKTAKLNGYIIESE